jgi:ABC-type microcin C transport system duplicated ATPase subunit YejF
VSANANAVVYVFIRHDLAVIRAVADEIAVMLLFAEHLPISAIFLKPEFQLPISS